MSNLSSLVLGMDCEESLLRSYPMDSEDDSSEISTVDGDDAEATAITPILVLSWDNRLTGADPPTRQNNLPFTKFNEVRNVTSIFPHALREKPIHDKDRF